jgi:hypothetical protein
MSDLNSLHNIRQFQAAVDKMEADAAIENFVRRVLARSAIGKDTPLHIIRAMGQALIDRHKQDLDNEARGN